MATQTKTEPTVCLIAMGSNMQTEAETSRMIIERAAVEVARVLGPVQQSGLYAAPCFPAGAGPDYVNAALALFTDLPAASVLKALHKIEADFGRQRVQRWGQRTLDLDLLALGTQVAPDLATFDHWQNLPLETQKLRAPDQLILPHPRLHERAFVLVPLADVAPTWCHPVVGQTVTEMLARCSVEDTAEVSLICSGEEWRI
ncbi:2-amino-4-hydroxy-6-hydroxymethyldihydropteridine diphosphokinase [Nereida ignava]|uniref:2-amino-4-hydroxy-6- hydroxymethyldihydropteridine diphosphokinase n=1 Tax=Nereida ignava TaxID=282199 RepID=UPI0023B6313D